ncbi:hypothetical protein MKW94_013376 [Papaver nudicaule]|uniref:non-specific serine/threonine protein kinase n=1 Tax=Papaver nudicaule TaxID=74823 RepID=A0AA41UWU1_PAPNU|nr:hypothetical protein [Papaver nudicaule]
MVAYLTDTEGSCSSNSENQTVRNLALRLYRVLLHLRGPDRLSELAEKCNLSTDSVRFLCSFLDSPVLLRKDLFVTIRIPEYFAASPLSSAMRVTRSRASRGLVNIDVIPQSKGDVRYYFRKRKNVWKNDTLSSTSVKRRRSLSAPEPGNLEHGNSEPGNPEPGNSEPDDETVTRIALAESIRSVSSTKVYIDFANMLMRNASSLEDDLPIVPHDCEILTQEELLAPLLLVSNFDSPCNGLIEIERDVTNDVEATTNEPRELIEYVYTPKPLRMSNCEIDINLPLVVAVEESEIYDGEPILLLTATVGEQTSIDQLEYGENIARITTPCLEGVNQGSSSPGEVVPDSDDFEASTSRMLRLVGKDGCKELHIQRYEGKNSRDTGEGLSVEAKDSCKEEQILSIEEKGSCKEGQILRIEGSNSCKEGIILRMEEKDTGKEGQTLTKCGTDGEGQEVALLVDSATEMEVDAKDVLGSMEIVNDNETVTSLVREKTIGKLETQLVLPSADLHTDTAKRQSTRSSTKAKIMDKDKAPGVGVVSDSQNCNKAVKSFKQQEQSKRDPMKHKLKQSCNVDISSKENRIDSTSLAPKNESETRALPDFESFIVEEEEGSGGYGTVYRARRKNDGKTFAIKCPHEKAHVHHVYNELKMLERFGGKNFVIKYEGSFKSGNSECFVLEHVDHDRPEALKKEIGIYELQWYGYCMFKALASLHKQGIVHRDVKPGNFLFSRKLMKGYLIDFNLAMDLQQKYSTNGKPKKNSSVNFDHIPLPSIKSASPSKTGKVTSSRVVDAGNQVTAKVSKPSVEPKSIRKRGANLDPSKAYLDLGSRQKLKTQVADVSGVTSANATSTRTPSGEKQREPMPTTTRKELRSLVEAIQSPNGPNQKRISFPSSQRKRVAAPPRQIDRKLFYLTPMPVHSASYAFAGSGMLNNKGDGKQKREGPCVGTKGFRAPEVLLKSPHQGPKVDVWSAGVTLLYLMIGRSPFGGDPEQNIKDIAKIRGSEDLWEVAKLHNRESSFPVELLDMQSLQSMKLQEWCKINTKRPEFINKIPRSLFDLIDKCLTVNPRLRISAEDALNHDFFAECHDRLRKQRLIRNSGSANLSQEQP